MCGIVGEWRSDGGSVDERWLVDARDTLISRGPDDAGLHLEPTLGLGHRRLSIIDLSSAGRMPMSNENGDVWAVFNGEIYNFQALRRELVAKGHVFRSHTDSEVILHAFEQWDTACFARFDGMFAIAIWDRRRQQIVLARDIAGEKPLFYAHDGSTLRFASTLRPLLCHRSAELDTDSVRRYVELGYVPAPFSLIRGVRKVPPGTFIVFGHTGAQSTRFWNLDDVAVTRRSLRDVSLASATDTLHELLRHAVRSRMIADVPLGAFLSGGIDSSVVVALMSEVSPDAVRTFTIGFDDPEADESAHAQRVASHLGVSNTTLVVSGADVLGELDEVPRAFDEPLADASILPSLAVARLARQHVAVALSGDGADEEFGGYRYYAGTRAFEWLSKVPLRLRERVAREASRISNPRVARAIRRGLARDGAEYFAHSGFHRGGTASSVPLVLGHPGHEAEQIAHRVRTLQLSAAEAGMAWDARETLPNAWLTKVDRTTMAVSLEARAPFLQRDVLEFAFRLPFAYRVLGTCKKVLLRRILARYMPRALFERPKQGFAPPLKRWFANELRAELHDRITADRMARFGVLDSDGIRRMLDDHDRGAADHTQMLWALFCLDRWYDATLLTQAAR